MATHEERIARIRNILQGEGLLEPLLERARDLLPAGMRSAGAAAVVDQAIGLMLFSAGESEEAEAEIMNTYEPPQFSTATDLRLEQAASAYIRRQQRHARGGGRDGGRSP